jgi:hypothetical protein
MDNLDVGSRMRWPLLAVAVTAISLYPAAGIAQIARTDVQAPKTASISDSALRATTYKLGTTAINLGLLSLAFGNVVEGGMLTAASTAGSWVLYTANDYIWSSYYPPPVKQTADQPFDASAQSLRATLKFISYKPVAVGLKMAMLYAYSGSLTTTFGWGTAITLTNTAWFFANDFAWNWYDWVTAPVDNPPRTPLLAEAYRPGAPQTVE